MPSHGFLSLLQDGLSGLLNGIIFHSDTGLFLGSSSEREQCAWSCCLFTIPTPKLCPFQSPLGFWCLKYYESSWEGWDLFAGSGGSAPSLAYHVAFESCTKAAPECTISNGFCGKPGTLGWGVRPSKSWRYPDSLPRSATRLSLPAVLQLLCSVIPHRSYDVGLGESTLQITAAELVMNTVLEPCVNFLMSLGTERHAEV